MTQVKIETVQKLDLHDGDIVHVKVGGEIQAGGGTEIWIPSQEELAEAFLAWADALSGEAGPKVGLIVTHHLIEPVILGSKLNLSTWPPKVLP